MGVSVSRRDATPCALLQKEASQRHSVAASQRQQRRSVAASQRRSANSVAASLPRPASQRRSANSVAASLPRRSVAAPTASQRHSSVAASQRQQCRSVTGPTAASQRRSVAAPPAPRSVAASQRHPPPGASQRNVGNPRFGPLCPCTVQSLVTSVSLHQAQPTKTNNKTGRADQKHQTRTNPTTTTRGQKRTAKQRKPKNERRPAAAGRTGRPGRQQGQEGGSSTGQGEGRKQLKRCPSGSLRANTSVQEGRATPPTCVISGLCSGYRTGFPISQSSCMAAFVLVACFVLFRLTAIPILRMRPWMIQCYHPSLRLPTEDTEDLPWTHGWTQSP